MGNDGLLEDETASLSPWGWLGGTSLNGGGGVIWPPRIMDRGQERGGVEWIWRRMGVWTRGARRYG
jgi:hypothetical protein